MDEEPWGGRSSPEMARSAGGDGGLAGSRTGSLGAFWRCGLGQKGEEEEGYKMVATVRQFALAVVRIEEGRPSGAGG